MTVYFMHACKACVCLICSLKDSAVITLMHESFTFNIYYARICVCVKAWDWHKLSMHACNTYHA